MNALGGSVCTSHKWNWKDIKVTSASYLSESLEKVELLILSEDANVQHLDSLGSRRNRGNQMRG
ncbi:uncharacterized protein Dyak_GE28012 [Drosophila yakuba]|uniref:Uncharacterized protein n=1 Tax=Drosophila yakuba TaxID=7245 RepID=A0A0R1E213_DROYA|nr:uncharacterized protein Dyak_GE28012 [Drosophila yakuba]